MDTLIISEATIQDMPDILEVSKAAWRPTYLPLLTAEQVDFMYEAIYNPITLTKTMMEERCFSLVIYDGSNPVGFAIVSPKDQKPETTKITKIYIKPDQQGKGVGKTLMQAVLEKAKEENFKKILLNVNKFNEKAIFFYKKCNFVIQYEEDIPIGRFWMNDFVMAQDL